MTIVLTKIVSLKFVFSILNDKIMETDSKKLLKVIKKYLQN